MKKNNESTCYYFEKDRICECEEIETIIGSCVSNVRGWFDHQDCIA